MKKIYLLQSEVNGLYKIGISKDPNKRVKELQTGSGEIIYLLHEYPSKYARKIEGAFHSSYSHVQKKGEWFDLDIFAVLDFLDICEKIEKNIIFIEGNKI